MYETALPARPARDAERSGWSLSRRGFLALGAGAGLAALLDACSGGDSAGGTASKNQILVIGSQMASFPSLDTGAITLAGYEGQRLIGNLIYEGLTKRDVSDPNKPAGLAPALATSWQVAADGLSYTFSLRTGVTFHDGAPWNADALLYNINRYTNPGDPHYVKALGTYYTVLTYVKDVKKVDEMTVTFNLKEKFAYFLTDLYNVYFASPTSLDKDGSAGQANHPVGTGPFTFTSLTPNQQITMTRNPGYWGGPPKLNQIVVQLIPDAAARSAALRSGRVNWIEAANPDDFAGLQAAGFKTAQNAFDWEWSWQLMVNQKPFDDLRVRQAMNYAIDREAIAKDLLHGTAAPAYQTFAAASPFYTEADNLYKYDPDKAKQLLTDAGYAGGLDIKVGYITAGSGAMQAKAMNEALQAQLAKVGIRVTLDPVDFAGMYAKLGAGNTGWQAVNQAFSLEQPSSWSWLFITGQNYFGYGNSEFDALWKQALGTTDDAARAKLLTQCGHLATADAAWMYVVNDTAPRAMAGSVRGYVQPKSWWVPFNTVDIG
ncbi:ABC transporter substrate-binding protein [Dactylosporangium sp. CA-092794]|uniref:ABC transporter substrate-binding protein n=1 Tax=Dactylosporangium sp. CA-092794 TaxID=3239929 RepID=UPI003D91391B